MTNSTPGQNVRTIANLKRARVARQAGRRSAPHNPDYQYRDAPLPGRAAPNLAGMPAPRMTRAGIPVPGRPNGNGNGGVTIPGFPDPGNGNGGVTAPGFPVPGNGNGNGNGNDNVNACFFPAPAPRRIYCYPAPFSQIGGDPYQPLVLAYGFSKPVQVL